jgi:Arc/MetJ family transcription regulator
MHILEHTMALVRTNITLPEELLAQVDEIAGTRGRSRYIADVVARQVRRDHLKRVLAETAGALAGSTSWGRTPEETDRILRELRDSWDRDEPLVSGDET